MIEIKLIDAEHKNDIYIPNSPFPLWGRMVPSYQNETWSYEIRRSDPDKCSEMVFPDEPYDYDQMLPTSFFLGAYDGGECVGLAILQRAFFKYLYLYDLKVNSSHRRQGIGQMLIDKCMEIARSENMRGVSLQAQDNNLSACLFYIKAGFRIGGLDTDIYKGTKQEGKADIWFYKDV